MKNNILALLSIFLFSSCLPQQKIANQTENHEIKPAKNDEGEWELDVLDSQYNYFLNAIAKPKNLYTENYLKSRNIFLVAEWNSYFYSGRYRNVIESSIDYNQNEKYGFEFEYKLYQVFAYVQWKYGLKLNGLSQADVR